MPPIRNAGQDLFACDASPDGSFSVRSSYKILTSKGFQNENIIWKDICRSEIIERARVFLWTLPHNAILTNQVRVARNFPDVPSCVRCSHQSEKALHAIRDCPQGSQDNALALSPQIKAHVSFIKEAKSHNMQVAGEHKYENVMIKWLAPEAGWIKFNSDGCHDLYSNKIKCGEVFRDHNGQWITGFHKNLGIGSVGSHPLSPIIKNIRSQLSRLKEFKVIHNFRESNRLADALALHDSTSEDIVIFYSIPTFYCNILQEDFRNLSLSRRVVI
ncbi:putative ribonuclease H protein At1g65750 family [Senna tora]|uniref:Putative ribonuclease H protein At1g65750 family n=1 Tax=Senna tora TaxID=362788 RepID=A0A834SYU8_9FABA|nr:putative ribonuclease H protein At1g65750 family [Senna tora]